MVRAGLTIGDYSPSVWTSGSCQVEIIHLQTGSSRIIEHRWYRPRLFPAVPNGPPPSPTSPAVHYAYPKLIYLTLYGGTAHEFCIFY